MNIIMIVFITFGILFLAGMFYNVILYQRPGIYPPKKLLKARITSLGSVGVILFAAGFLISIFLK